jgi:protein-S-isoprenylcysteine O-methyltransferase Ste14
LFKYLYLLFAVLVIINKTIVTFKIHKIDKVKGKILYPFLTKLIYIFYFIPVFIPPIEFMLVKRSVNYYISSAALLAYLFSWILSLWAIKTMDRYWTVEIEIRDDHPLIKRGPYRFMRHPHYLFILCELFCLPLIANAYYSLVLTAAIYIPLMAFRIILEEREMINKFGARYLEYRKEVWGLFPVPVFKKGVRS